MLRRNYRGYYENPDPLRKDTIMYKQMLAKKTTSQKIVAVAVTPVALAVYLPMLSWQTRKSVNP